MITKIGSQSREKLEDTGYTIESRAGKTVILTDGETYEQWQRNDHFAGYVIEIDGKGYEFCCTVNNFRLKTNS